MKPTHVVLLIAVSLPSCYSQAATGYFDAISEVVSQGQSSTTALKGSTEASQF